MRKLTTREKVLLGLVAAGGVGYLWYASSRGVNIGAGSAGQDDKDSLLAESAPEVPLDLLSRPVESFDGRGRDLFQYSQRPPSAEELERLRLQREAEQRAREAAERERQRRLKEKAEAPKRPQRTNVGPREALKPQPPNIPFKYIGYLGPQRNRIAAFLDGEELLLARNGEGLKDKFQVVEIRYDTVVMGFTDPQFRDQTRELPLAETGGGRR